jgi:FMN reductase
VILAVSDELQGLGCSVDVLDLSIENLPMLNVDTSFSADYYAPLKERVMNADAFILGTPDYHGSISGAMKNFLDHFWKEFAGKLFGTVVASHEKGLTVTDQLRTVARQCYAWCLPYGVSFMEKQDATAEDVVSDALKNKISMLANDVSTYGRLLAKQRAADIAGATPRFLAHHRK